MSSTGNLCTGEYTKKCVEAALKSNSSDGFCIGFIGQRRVELDVQTEEMPDFLVLSPGIGLDMKGDSKDQNYRTPLEVIKECGSDVIIVGRGIYGPILGLKENTDEKIREEVFEKVGKEAERYRIAGWEAYEEKMKENGVDLEKREVETQG